VAGWLTHAACARRDKIRKLRRVRRVEVADVKLPQAATEQVLTRLNEAALLGVTSRVIRSVEPSIRNHEYERCCTAAAEPQPLTAASEWHRPRRTATVRLRRRQAPLPAGLGLTAMSFSRRLSASIEWEKISTRDPCGATRKPML
jgi:hypothetical protein